MGNKILRVIERVLCVSVCCCKKWSKEPLKRGRRRRTFLYLEKLPKNTNINTKPTYKRGKKRVRLRFTYRLKTLHSHFSHLHFLHMHFCGGDSIVIISSNRSMMMCVLFLDWTCVVGFFERCFCFLFFSFFFHQHSSYNSRVVNNCISIIISITRRRDDNHDGHRR